MARELAKVYDPGSVEDRTYAFWQEGNFFHAEVDPEKEPYTIVMYFSFQAQARSRNFSRPSSSLVSPSSSMAATILASVGQQGFFYPPYVKNAPKGVTKNGTRACKGLRPRDTVRPGLFPPCLHHPAMNTGPRPFGAGTRR